MHTTPATGLSRYRIKRIMSAFANKYFALDGGLSYHTFLKHFKAQASGEGRLTLLKQDRGDKCLKTYCRKGSSTGSLVLLDLSDQPTGGGNKRQELPKIEVVDPAEADRRRALDQVEMEVRDRDIARLTYGAQGPDRAHYAAGRSKKKSSNNKRSSNTNTATTATAKKLVKKVKDVFD